jgi:catalase
MSNIVHEYFKKNLDGDLILVRVNPHSFEGLELLVSREGQIKKTVRNFEEDVFEDLQTDDFEKASALEFNLYLNDIPK